MTNMGLEQGNPRCGHLVVNILFSSSVKASIGASQSSQGTDRRSFKSIFPLHATAVMFYS